MKTHVFESDKGGKSLIRSLSTILGISLAAILSGCSIIVRGPSVGPNYYGGYVRHGDGVYHVPPPRVVYEPRVIIVHPSGHHDGFDHRYGPQHPNNPRHH